jgi:hypothetical protein
MKKLPKRDGIRHEPRRREPSTEETIRTALHHMIRVTVANIEEREGPMFGNVRGRKGYARISIGVPFAME